MEVSKTWLFWAVYQEERGRENRTQIFVVSLYFNFQSICFKKMLLNKIEVYNYIKSHWNKEVVHINSWKTNKQTKTTPNQKLLESITNLQEENFLTEVLASLAPRDLEVQMKQFKAEDLHVQNDTTNLLSSDLWLKNNGHGVVNHITLWLYLLLQTQ